MLRWTFPGKGFGLGAAVVAAFAIAVFCCIKVMSSEETKPFGVVVALDGREATVVSCYPSTGGRAPRGLDDSLDVPVHRLVEYGLSPQAKEDWCTGTLAQGKREGCANAVPALSIGQVLLIASRSFTGRDGSTDQSCRWRAGGHWTDWSRAQAARR